MRTAFQRDRDRIVHAASFRRLEYKTQVFVSAEGDHYRNRLTHSLEVAQITRTLARVLEVDEDLAETVALAHDLGHSPFGHAGEAALNQALAGHGGFDHNVQTFRIVTRLERRYAEFDGLNLTFETLEGVVKHNGPLAAPPRPVADHPLAAAVELGSHAPVEAQLAAVADDLAYCNHDLDDGLRAGLITLDELAHLPLVGAALAEVDRRYPSLEQGRRRHETIRRLIDRMVRDLVQETRRRLDALAPGSVDAVRWADGPTVAFSAEMLEAVTVLRAFLWERVYRHYTVQRRALSAGRVVADLFATLATHPDCLPDGWRERAAGPHAGVTLETVRDYIAGMTDRFAVDEHDRLFVLSRGRL